MMTGITFKGVGYFREKQERKVSEVKKWAWDTFKWLATCLIPLLVGFFLGKH
jgi:uncharacterized membrane protein YukC